MADHTVAAEMMIRQSVRDKYYGEITFKFEAGNIVLIRRLETIKPSSERDTRSDDGLRTVGGAHNSRF